jgi:hypothetical protein
MNLAIGQNTEPAYQAYVKNSQTLWKHAVKESHALYESEKSDESLFQLALTEYGLLNATMSDENEALFDQYIDGTDDHLDLLIDRDYRSAEVKAIISAVSGLKIAYSPWKGMILGPKCGFMIDEAMSTGGDLAIVQKLYANYLFFTPGTWGGDVDKSIQFYERSIASFEREGLTDHWLYLDAWVWMGQALIDEERINEGISALERAREIAPGFTWVEDVLLPEARESLYE